MFGATKKQAQAPRAKSTPEQATPEKAPWSWSILREKRA